MEYCAWKQYKWEEITVLCGNPHSASNFKNDFRAYLQMENHFPHPDLKRTRLSTVPLTGIGCRHKPSLIEVCKLKWRGHRIGGRAIFFVSRGLSAIQGDRATFAGMRS
jgi:hypothetical protein